MRAHVRVHLDYDCASTCRRLDELGGTQTLEVVPSVDGCDGTVGLGDRHAQLVDDHSHMRNGQFSRGVPGDEVHVGEGQFEGLVGIPGRLSRSWHLVMTMPL
jgi:hypothetical protein